jgi:peptide/nickel transport system substrate-binding protein
MMKRSMTSAGLIGLAGLLVATPAMAQKQGGILRGANSANPASLSVHEEVSIATVMPISPVFSNLVYFDPLKPVNTPETIQPELATSWSYDATGTKLSFKLRQGVKWHDGKPFSAKDVQCTWHRLSGKEPAYFRKNPRKIWWENIKEVTIDAEDAVTFHLNRPQPSLLPMLASGFAPVYPCHVEAKDMRMAPIGTGPFKLVEYKSNDVVRMARNPDYWKKGQPYLDGIEWRIVPNRSTRVLGLSAGEFDLTSTGDITVPLMKDIKQRSPQIICELGPTNVWSNVLINPTKPPFDNPKLRRAVALSLDRESFITILSHGVSQVSGNLMPLPEGLWGMPKEKLMALPTYGGSVEERRAEARKLMESLGYGPNNKLKIKVSTRDFAAYKDPAVILVDQLKQIHFDTDLETIESSVWFGRAARQDYAIALNLTGAGLDDPDVALMENFACNSQNNFSKYCNQEVEKLLLEQSNERDVAKRKEIVWKIEHKLAEDVARPVISHGNAAQCRHPHVKGFLRAMNSIYNNWRLDQVWFDK